MNNTPHVECVTEIIRREEEEECGTAPRIGVEPLFVCKGNGLDDG